MTAPRDPSVPTTAGTGEHAGPAAPPDAPDLVDWRRTALRMRRSALVIGVAVVVVWLVAGVLGGGPTLGGLAGWVGLGLVVLFGAEVVVVGGAAVRGMLRAGERGERLSSQDVGLLPRLRRRD